MATRRREPRPASFWLLALVFAAFVLFLYGPMFAIFVLSLQGPEGGLTFPMRGWSLHWLPQENRFPQASLLSFWAIHVIFTFVSCPCRHWPATS